MNIVVLISGSGSNLQAIIDACIKGTINGNVAAVISNRPDVYGLQRAQEHAIPAAVVDHKNYCSREEFEKALIKKIDQFEPNLVVLAGFMRILTPGFVNHYLGRMLNIHPSLLPKFPGLNTHQRAIDAKEKVHGATVHFVTAELDGGPPVLQAEVKIESGDTAETLAARVLTKEHQIYAQAVAWFAENRLQFKNGLAYLDGELVQKNGVMFSGD